MTAPDTEPPQRARQRAMSAFAQARRDELRLGLDRGVVDDTTGSAWTWLRKPEIGLVMARGRTGGSGAPFNFGEVAVTRCAIVIESGETGHATIMGRDKEKARLAALADACWQVETERATVETTIVEPVLARLARQDAQIGAETQATKVDFFTMTRGENQK